MSAYPKRKSMPEMYQQLGARLIGSVIVICLGSLQFGFHMAELNAPQQAIMCHVSPDPSYADTWLGRHGWKQCFPLSESQFGLVTSIFSLGGLVGSLCAGSLADRCGRRGLGFWNCMLAALGSTLVCSSNTYGQLLIGRAVTGVACGSSIVVASVFVNEVAPKWCRGTLGSLNQVLINVGVLLTQVLALWLANTLWWRWLLFSGSVIAIGNWVLLFFVDESPRWLAARGKIRAAEAALARLRACSLEAASEEAEEWSQPGDSSMGNDRVTWMEYLTNSEYSKSKVVIAVILIGQQLSGINSIIFYGVRLISAVLPDYAVQVNVTISVLNIAFTLVAAALIERCGRKPLLMWSCLTVAFATSLISFSILSHIKGLLVYSTFAYISAFAIGLGPIPFLIITELSSARTAAVAQGFGITLNWLAIFTVGVFFPVFYDYLKGYTFALFGIAMVLMAAYIKKYVPETGHGHSYEELWQAD